MACFSNFKSQGAEVGEGASVSVLPFPEGFWTPYANVPTPSPKLCTPKGRATFKNKTKQNQNHKPQIIQKSKDS